MQSCRLSIPPSTRAIRAWTPHAMVASYSLRSIGHRLRSPWWRTSNSHARTSVNKDCHYGFAPLEDSKFRQPTAEPCHRNLDHPANRPGQRVRKFVRGCARSRRNFRIPSAWDSEYQTENPSAIFRSLLRQDLITPNGLHPRLPPKEFLCASRFSTRALNPSTPDR